MEWEIGVEFGEKLGVGEFIVAFDTRGFEGPTGQISQEVVKAGNVEGSQGDAGLMSMRSARARVSCWPTWERELLIRTVQDTAEVLSHQMASWTWCRQNMWSMMR